MSLHRRVLGGLKNGGAMKNFDELTGADGVVVFLEEQGGKSEFFCHYTTFDVLKKILTKDKSYFFLTRGNSKRLNDRHEYQCKGSDEVWERLYIGCFGTDKLERVAMWGLYGVPREDAVRIEIPGGVMRKWLVQKPNVYAVDYEGNATENKIEDSNIEYLRLARISYIKEHTDRNLVLTYKCRNKIHELKTDTLFDREAILTGFLKNITWEYEAETRIRLLLKESLSPEQLALELSDEIKSTITVTLGPNFKMNNDRMKVFKQLSPDYKESKFTGKLNYRIPCDVCKLKCKMEANTSSCQ